MTDIDGRMNAWHGADIHPEMASRFLKNDEVQPIRSIEDFAEWEQFMDEDTKKNHEGMKKLMDWSGFGKTPEDRQLVEDWYKQVSTPKGADDPRWGYIESKKKGFNKSEDISPEEYQAMADAAAEEGPDDFEAPGIKHMRDTKKERNEAIQPVVQNPDKTWGAFFTGSNSKHSPDSITKMDVNVDTASYLEDLMSKGLITDEQYKEARQAFDNGSQEYIYFPSL